MKDIAISPSLLSCDFSKLGQEIAAVAAAGADFIHVDVMDGHFVPNITIGVPVVESIKKVSPLPLDVHLMITNPLKYVGAFADAGSDIITFHIESEDDPAQTIAAIQGAGAKAGIALKPGTPAEDVMPYLYRLDLLLVMTVEPGFGGQGFMDDICSKIRTLKDCCDNLGLCPFIEVDGGINSLTAPKARDAGANLLVAGSAVFTKPDYTAAISALRP